MASIRTFIAFDTPLDIKKEILQVQISLKESAPDVKWEAESKFHVTLKFLGNVEENMLPKILNVIKNSLTECHQFPVIYQGVGAFPNKKRPRVLWVGCNNPDNHLIEIKNKLDKDLKPYGFEIEDRQFHPHITLGRVKSESGINNLIKKLENVNFEPRQVSINEILAVKSVLKPGGSEYTKLMTIPLQT